jgi:hypothetical protein
MIHNKLEIRYVIHSLNELEKLKLLLFDENQYFLFEHIPKPYLINGEMVKKIDDQEEKVIMKEKEMEQPEVNVNANTSAEKKANTFERLK